MITKLKLTNFRSIGSSVEIPLDRLNLFVGVNGSGKSNVLRSLTFLREAMKLGLPGAVTNSNGIGSVRRHSTGHPHNVRIEVDLALDAGPSRYGFELTGDSVEEYRVKAEWAEVSLGTGEQFTYRVQDGVFSGPAGLQPNLDAQSLALTALGGDPRLRPLSEFLSNTMVYSINPAALRVPQKFSSETPMQSHGENWVSILHSQENAKWKADLVSALKKLTGDIDDVKVTKAASFLIAEFKHHSGASSKSKRWFSSDRESDGTLRVAGILTALLQEPSLRAIGIEEPEQTVHPGALPLLFDYLREASTRSQVLVTTHSPELLNHVSLDDCRVFTVGRGEAGTLVRPLTDDQRDSVKKELLSLGDLMLTGDLQLDLPWGESE